MSLREVVERMLAPRKEALAPPPVPLPPHAGRAELLHRFRAAAAKATKSARAMNAPDAVAAAGVSAAIGLELAAHAEALHEKHAAEIRLLRSAVLHLLRKEIGDGNG